MKNITIWLIVAPIIVLAVLYVAIFHPDITQPVARGLSGHYYIEESDSVIRCYDLSNSTKSDVTNTVIGNDKMTAWNVSYDNTQFVAAYRITANDKPSFYVRRYNIRGSKLINDRQGSRPLVVPGVVRDLSISPDGKTSVLVMHSKHKQIGYQTEFYDLDTHQMLNIVLPSCSTKYPEAPKWDKFGRRLVYKDQSEHMVIHDMARKTNTVLADAGSGVNISPDSKLAHLYPKDGPPYLPYLRRLDENIVVPLNRHEDLANWSPDSQGYDYKSLHIILYSLHYYDIKTGRSYRMPVPFNGNVTRWVK